MAVNGLIYSINQSKLMTIQSSSIDIDPTPTTDALLLEDNVSYALYEDGGKILIKTSS